MLSSRLISTNALITLSLLVAGVLNVCAQAEEPKGAEDLKVLETLFYEKMHDPTFDGEVRFITGVPLISRVPDCSPKSQYYTSLILQARLAIVSLYQAKIGQIAIDIVQANADYRTVPRSPKTNALARMHQRIFGVLAESALANLMHGNWGEHTHPHLDKNDEGSREDHHLAVIPGRIGFTASHSEVTTGLHALKQVDDHLRSATDFRGAIFHLLGTDAIDWQIFDHEQVRNKQCERFIACHIPFVIHREREDILVCGYAEYRDREYLLGFDLSTIERRVSVNSGGGGMTYTEYTERQGAPKVRDPSITWDPLFWDYTSYFSIRNLACFRIVPLNPQETVTAVYPIRLDEERVVAIANEELGRARDENQRGLGDRVMKKHEGTTPERKP